MKPAYTLQERIDRALASGLTPEQAKIIGNFEDANESQDLHAIGITRRQAAEKRVAIWYQRVMTANLGRALTANEKASGYALWRQYPEVRE